MKPWTVLTNLHDRELLAQIEAVDIFTDSMHAYPGVRSASSTTASSAPTISPTAGSRSGPVARPRGGRAPCWRCGARRRDRPGGGLPPRRRAAPDAPRLNSTPRRAVISECDRPGRPRHDLEAARPLSGRACNTSCTARDAAGGRASAATLVRPCLGLFASPRSSAAASPRPPPPRSRGSGRRQGRPPRRRQPHREGSRGSARSRATTLARPAALGYVPGRRFGLKMSQAKLVFDAPLTARARPPRAAQGRRSRSQLGAQGRAGADRADRRRRSTARRATRPQDQAAAMIKRPTGAAAARGARGTVESALAKRIRGRARDQAEAQGGQGEGPHDGPRTHLPGCGHHRPLALPAAAVQAAEVRQGLRRRRRPARLPDPGGPLRDPRTSRSTRPGPPRTRRGRASTPAPRTARWRRLPTRSRRAGWGSSTASASTARARTGRSAAAPRTAASACTCPT